MPAFSWNRRATATATFLRLGVARATARSGSPRAGTEDGVRGPSSFDIGPGGRVVVADPVNRRLEWFDRRGRFLRAQALPTTRPVDVAAGAGGRVAVATLGTESTAYDLDATGVRGSYPVAFGVVSRVAAGAVPRVRVGAAQWVPFRGPGGAALGAAATGLRPRACRCPTVGSATRGSCRTGAWRSCGPGPTARERGSCSACRRGQRGRRLLRPPARRRRCAGRPRALGRHALRRRAAAMRRNRTRASFVLLPEPSHILAPYSTVRALSPRSVLLAVDVREGIHLERFAVGGGRRDEHETNPVCPGAGGRPGRPCRRRIGRPVCRCRRLERGELRRRRGRAVGLVASRRDRLRAAAATRGLRARAAGATS